MDYHDDTAGTARLAVIKYSATASRKLGTIFFNPGNSLYPPLQSSTHIPFSQVDPAGQGWKLFRDSARHSVQISKVPLTSFPGILAG